jgi:LAS superfamily LD-carboxypeptidase LdcB
MLTKNNWIDTSRLAEATHEFYELQGDHPDLRLATPETIRSLSENAAKLIELTYRIDSAEYGVSHPMVPSVFNNDTAKRLVALEEQRYTHDGQPKVLGIQYVPLELANNLHEMNSALLSEGGTPLLVQSGFRSPTYQAITFLRLLLKNSGNLSETVKRVAPPNRSEHGDYVNLAVDFMRPDIYGDDNDFEMSHLYPWLGKHAAKFGFSLSFPEGNPQGIDFEPWHWRFSSSSPR